MPPEAGCDDGKPGDSGGAVRAADSRPYDGKGSGCTRRGGYQPPEKATDSRRTPAERCRAACPHAAMTGLR